MFQNWGFLLGEIWVLLLIAALLGLFCGWLIWGRGSRSAAYSASSAAAVGTASAATTSDEAIADAHASGKADYDGDGVIEGSNEGSRPAAMTAEEAGTPDDLKLIKGIGPKLEKLCNSLGVYKFSQIASWGASEVAWMDANLEGFYGRVSRDEWVAQAKILASGGETEFSKRASSE